MSKTKIEWADRTWNPVTGCTKVSAGCANCYAERNTKRFYPDKDFSKVELHSDRLNEPLRWKKPGRIFVCSMSDLFHDDVPDEFLDMVFAYMAKARKHTFLILTKRPERMQDYIAKAMYDEDCSYRGWYDAIDDLEIPDETPMENVWLGVTAENQEQADKRIPILLQTPDAKRFVSVEPMLGSVRLDRLCRDKSYSVNALRGIWESNDSISFNQEPPSSIPKIDWVICGGESGPEARPMCPNWTQNLRDQCQEAGVPFLFKQWGEWWPIHGTGNVLPEEREKAYRFCWVTPSGEIYNSGCDPDALMLRVGKRKAGRLLDGKIWDEYPSDSK